MNTSLSRTDKVYIFIVALFSMLLVLSNIVVVKLCKIPFTSYAMTAGLITYPFTFVMTDIVSEIWGESRAKMMIYFGLVISIIMSVFVQIILHLPPHQLWATVNNPFGYETTQDFQNSFASIFSINGKVILGSMTAFLISQLLDIRIFLFLKRLFGGRYLWLRNCVSTCTSQLLDTVIVSIVILFWGLGLDFNAGMEIMTCEYLFKVAFAILDIPIMYLCVSLIRKYFIRTYAYKQAA